ncbi:MAG TPA: hypothetical protein VHP36_10600 [Chitinispirillaceae bacterium]|nr:hypothetical protein [Chitinispirillaceae bacterium]
MQFISFLPLFLVLSFSISYCAEVALILHGRIVQDNSSLAPLANINFRTNSTHYASVFGSDSTDTTGYFFMPVRIGTGMNFKKNDSLYLSYTGFSKSMPINGIGNPMQIINSTKEITFLNNGVLKGDTIRIEVGKNGSFPTFDGAFGYSNPYDSSYADQKILPDWVSMDECTGRVCIRVTAPASTGISECKLVKNLDYDLVYTFNFFIDVQQGVPIVPKHKTASVSSRFSNNSCRIKGGHIITGIYLSEPGVICAGIFSVNGREITPSKTVSLDKGYNYLSMVKPMVPGVYFLKLSNGESELTRSFYLQE